MTQYGISPVGRQQPAGTIQHLPSVERYNELILILFLSPESKIINTHHSLTCRLPIGIPPKCPLPIYAIRRDTPMPGVAPANKQNGHRIGIVKQIFWLGYEVSVLFTPPSCFPRAVLQTNLPNLYPPVKLFSEFLNKNCEDFVRIMHILRMFEVRSQNAHH